MTAPTATIEAHRNAPATRKRPGADHGGMSSMAPQGYKACSRCGETKLLDDFYKDRREKDGLYSCCKPCHLSKTKAWRDANPEKNKAAIDNWTARQGPDYRATRLREWRARNPEKTLESVERYERRNPEKIYARRAVDWAVRQGKLTRPDSCEACGAADKPLADGRSSIQGHHPDYSKPLEVEWLCVDCHAARHKAAA